jgi:hypothetical protein
MPLVVKSGALTKPPLLARDIVVYHLAEDLTGFLLYFMAVFSPWAFGTTEPWSIWTMRGCGYGVGFLLLVKLAIRGIKGYSPARWGERNAESGKSTQFTHSGLTRILAVLTVLFLSSCSAI